MSSAKEMRRIDEMDQDSVPVAVITSEENTVTETTTEIVVLEQQSNNSEFQTTTEKGSMPGVSKPEKSATNKDSVGFHMPQGPVTIGEALEKVASRIGDKPLTVSDARAIQSAEAIATGIPSGVKGGLGGAALSAVDSSRKEVKIAHILADASSHVPNDKIVSPADAARVHSAEARNNDGETQKGGVSSTMQQAAAYNQNAGFLPGADGEPQK